MPLSDMGFCSSLFTSWNYLERGRPEKRSAHVAQRDDVMAGCLTAGAAGQPEPTDRFPVTRLHIEVLRSRIAFDVAYRGNVEARLAEALDQVLDQVAGAEPVSVEITGVPPEVRFECVQIQAAPFQPGTDADTRLPVASEPSGPVHSRCNSRCWPKCVIDRACCASNRWSGA